MVPHLYRIDESQKLPIPLEECWSFFSNPRNLSLITPPSLDFQVLGDEPGRFEPGMILLHRVRPFPGVRIRWVTEITHVIPNKLFVDEQRFGPYRFWHHQHLFEAIPGGTLVRDLVHYAMPGGPIGWLTNRINVAPQLRTIFGYRVKKLEEMFGTL